MVRIDFEDLLVMLDGLATVFENFLADQCNFNQHLDAALLIGSKGYCTVVHILQLTPALRSSKNVFEATKSSIVFCI